MTGTTILPGFEAIAPPARRGRHLPTQAELQRIAGLSRSGFGYKRIVKATGIPKSTVLRNLRRLGLTDPKRKQFSAFGVTGKKYDPHHCQREAFLLEMKWVRKNDNHWARHPDVVAWSANARRKKDPSFRMMHDLRCRLRFYIRNGKHKEHMNRLIGCSHSELKAHIAKHFKKGMTWNNQGRHGWHIDHVKPCTAFDLLDPHQQAQCFHFSNLQPLWESDNIRKSDKLKDGRRARSVDIQLGLRLPVR
jgi:hypothetical protein